MADVIMPKMGDAMDEGKIVQWLKRVGDRVEIGLVRDGKSQQLTAVIAAAPTN